MNDGILLAGIALGIVGIVAMALRRRQERSMLDQWGAGHGWSVERHDFALLSARLARAAVLQIGHSRRILGLISDPNGVQLLEYGFETGVEHTRASHRLMVVVAPAAHGRGRAAFGKSSWVLSAVAEPAMRRLSLSASTEAHETGSVSLVEDPERWPDLPSGDFGRRLSQEPPARTWEVLPEALVGYQPAPIAESELEGLVSAGKELAGLLAGAPRGQE